MRRIAGCLAAAGLLVAAASAAQAETPVALTNGFYAGVQGGGSWLRGQNWDRAGTGVAARYKDGFALGGHVGYGYGQVGPLGLRTELDLTWRHNGIKSLAGQGASGRVESLTPMLNLIADIPTGTRLTPFIGIGAGASHVSVHGARTATFANASGSQWRAAWQAMAGATFALTDQWALRADYRYLDAGKARITADNGDRVGVPYASHTAMLGLTFRFGAPARPAPQPVAAAPAPAPEPPPPQPAALPSSYMVFFDWNSAVVSDEARTVLTRAAQALRQGQRVRVDLTGHADRSGSDAYNLRLSQRRADAVKAVLVAMGVPTDAVTTTALGETSPLVATPDGVREPQNRRVEIVLP